MIANLILFAACLILIVVIVLGRLEVIGEEWWPALTMIYILLVAVFITQNFIAPALA